MWPSVENTGLSCGNFTSTLDLQGFDRLYQSMPHIYTMKLLRLAYIRIKIPLSKCVVLLYIFSVNDVFFPENGPSRGIGDILRPLKPPLCKLTSSTLEYESIVPLSLDMDHFYNEWLALLHDNLSGFGKGIECQQTGR